MHRRKSSVAVREWDGMTDPGPTLAALRRALVTYRTHPTDRTGKRLAAVAAILRPRGHDDELLFIHRAEHERDPWSGHMAFPGGRVDPKDSDPQAAVRRETQEEIGLDLAAEATLLGQLSDVAAIGRGRPLPMVIVPFVFELASEPSLVPNYEVQETVWVPLQFLADQRNREIMQWHYHGVPLPLPSLRFEGNLIWGLTLRMADELLNLAR
jgi:8-oxo-dGTP pyrophosphatase MutT (NUDIX family)